MGMACSSRVATTCAALAALAVSTPARAQESDAPGPAPLPSGDVLELQFGAGYLFRDGDLAFLPSVEMGVVLWWHESWGLSLRRSTTIGEHMASYDYGGGTRTGAQFSSLDGDATVPPRLGLDPGVESRRRTDVWRLRPSHLASWRGAEFAGGVDAGWLQRDLRRGARRQMDRAAVGGKGRARHLSGARRSPGGSARRLRGHVVLGNPCEKPRVYRVSGAGSPPLGGVRPVAPPNRP